MRSLHLILAAAATFALSACAIDPSALQLNPSLQGLGAADFERISSIGEGEFKERSGWAVPGEPSGFVEFYMARGSAQTTTSIRRGTPPGSRAQVYAENPNENAQIKSDSDPQGATDHVRFSVPTGPQYFVLEYPGGLFYPMTVNVEADRITPVSIWWVRDAFAITTAAKFSLDGHAFPSVAKVYGPLQRQRHPRSGN
jgi:hypothetical protein